MDKTKNKDKHINAHIILGQNIRERRLASNLSQEELAFKISSARNYVGCIERGEKSPSINILLDIAKVLNCKISDLFKNI